MTTNVREEHRIRNAQLPRKEAECGFFIACDDQAILKCVNAMLLNSGMLGLSDQDGKTHYLIDGRRGGNYVISQVKRQVFRLSEDQETKSAYEEAFLSASIDNVIHEYGLSPTLVGTQIIRALLILLYRDPGLLKCASKSLYPLVKKQFQMTPAQIERNLRYAIKKSRKLQGETRVLLVLREMMNRTMEDVMSRYGRSVVGE